MRGTSPRAWLAQPPSVAWLPDDSKLSITIYGDATKEIYSLSPSDLGRNVESTEEETRQVDGALSCQEKSLSGTRVPGHRHRSRRRNSFSSSHRRSRRRVVDLVVKA